MAHILRFIPKKFRPLNWIIKDRTAPHYCEMCSAGGDRGGVVRHMVDSCLSHGSVPPEEAADSAEKSGISANYLS